MDIFLNSFYNNPAGKGSSFLNLKATKKEFDERYSKIIKKISIKSVVTKRDNLMYLLIKIPSSAEGIFYDVVLEFANTKNSAGPTVDDKTMKIFSNSPSFVYSYLYAYVKKGIFIKKLKNKLPDNAFTKSDVKNPYNILSYDFSVYAALKFVIDNGYNTITNINMIAAGNDFSIVQKIVQQYDRIQKDRTVEKNAERERKKEEKIKQKKEIKNIGKKAPEEEKPAITKVKNVPTSKRVKVVAKSKGAKKVKRI